jgi:hypothetical protein
VHFAPALVAVGLHKDARHLWLFVGFDGTSVPTSEFRVEKSRTEATLTLSSGASVRGCFFVSGSSRTHSGPERVKDVLNAETGFFPFEVIGIAGSSTVLYNREHLVMVKLADKDEARSEPGYDVATVRIITVVLSNGTRLHASSRSIPRCRQ